VFAAPWSANAVALNGEMKFDSTPVPVIKSRTARNPQRREWGIPMRSRKPPRRCASRRSVAPELREGGVSVPEELVAVDEDITAKVFPLRIVEDRSALRARSAQDVERLTVIRR
jgi:hypothetical protein